MPRPKTKKELIDLSTKNYNRLLDFITSLSKEQLQQEFPEGYLNRNISDVVAHLHHWHLMMLNWYTVGMDGKKPEMPAKGYTWKTTPDLNRKIWEQYKDTELNEVKKLVHHSFEKLQKVISNHTEEELFEKRRYKWTGTTSLASYPISATSSHYDWAYKLIKKCLKQTPSHSKKTNSMKTLIACLIALSFMACKKDVFTKKTTIPETTEIEQNTTNDIIDSITFITNESIELEQEKTKSIKRERLITAKDDKAALQEVVIDKKLYKEEDMYILDYKYPYLNEEIDIEYAEFNDFIAENYLNIEATENEILEDKVIYCDSLGLGRCMDKRIIDYKIYSVKNKLLSVMLYKENYYSGMKHSTYMFECLNFDLNTYNFIYYNDFFVKNSEKEVLATINKIITENIYSGEMYYDCWQLSETDFRVYKNNFVINDDTIEFYFDDCIICPSYTGTYSIEIPITSMMHLIKKYNKKPLIG